MKSRNGRKSVGEEIVDRLQAFLHELESGVDVRKTHRYRTVEVDPDAPVDHAYIASQTRKMIGANQSVFAAFIGVPVQTVRAWEKGTEVPSDIAQRFLYEIRLDPDHWRARLRQMAVPKKRKRVSKTH